MIQYRFNRSSTEYCYYSRTRYASGAPRLFLFTFLIFPCSTRRFPLVHSVVVYSCSYTVCLRHYHLRACRKYFFFVASPGHAPRLVVFSTLINAAPYCSVFRRSWFIFSIAPITISSQASVSPGYRSTSFTSVIQTAGYSTIAASASTAAAGTSARRPPTLRIRDRWNAKFALVSCLLRYVVVSSLDR